MHAQTTQFKHIQQIKDGRDKTPTIKWDMIKNVQDNKR